jgi:hypothetical protein
VQRYSFPEIGDSTLAYKGRRYWIIELSQEAEIVWVTKADADFVMWDGSYNGILALLWKKADGSFKGELTTTLPLGEYQFQSIREAAQSIPAIWDWYFKNT